jgi:REP element-mobilizing transposase RayT
LEQAKTQLKMNLASEQLDHVAQPPSAGEKNLQLKSHPGAAVLHASQPGAAVPHAKPIQPVYRRNLPHINSDEKPLYITFCSYKRWIFPESVRNLVLRHCLHDHEKKYWLHAVIVMPDHVHMILSLYEDKTGCLFGMSEIMNGIKGASAHSINKALRRKGSVWQAESFDHILRSSESIVEKADYIWNNPVRKNLVKTPDEWPWFWAEWMEKPKL